MPSIQLLSHSRAITINAVAEYRWSCQDNSDKKHDEDKNEDTDTPPAFGFFHSAQSQACDFVEGAFTHLHSAV